MTRAKTDQGFRPEIQALRAIAVGSVLLYHLWPGRVPGGFVGVDVFFVISGYLITGHLVRDLEATGRVRLGRFWARRARRLLPASLLVLAVVAVATLTLAPLSQQPDWLGQVLASTFYVENWALVHKAVDYLAADRAASPVQHYWSLGVEEQFYLVTPLLLIGLTWLSARLGRQLHVVALPVMAGLALVSLGLSIHQTATSPALAYFSTATRAWEFLLGAVLSGMTVRRGQAALGWAGMVAIAAGVFLFDGHTPFPGYAAALPALGAVAVIAAGPRGGVALLARLRPVTWIGDISYAVYLWHWPMIVLVPAATGQHLGFVARVVILVVTLLLAWVSTTYVEEPLRRIPRSLDGRRPLALVGVTALLATTLVGGLTAAGAAHARERIDGLQRDAERLLASGDLHCLGANSLLDPQGCPDLGDALVPAPAAAEGDDGNEAPCWTRANESELHLCSFGRTKNPTLRVLAVGDSHNNALIPAYKALAAERGWSLDVAGRAGCSWTTGTQQNSSRDFRNQCRAWKREVAEHLASHPAYDLIITTSRQAGAPIQPVGDETPEEATVRSMHEAWASQVRRGTEVLVLRDVPRARPDVNTCVEREGLAAATKCRTRLGYALGGYDAAAQAVAQTPGTALVDYRDVFCGPRSCSPVIGHVVVYLDTQHVTETFARTLAPTMGKRIDDALARLRKGA